MIFKAFSLFLISLLGAMSPGPDFVIVTRYALLGSRKAGLLATLGVTLALVIHVTYCSLGLAVLLTESKGIFHFIQALGSLYLAYLGIRLLIPSNKKEGKKGDIHQKAFFAGFLTNLLNPKAIFFILSLFTQFIDPSSPIGVLFIYGSLIPVAALLWFSFLTVFITHPYFNQHFAKIQKGLEKGMGILLLALSLMVLISILNS